MSNSEQCEFEDLESLRNRISYHLENCRQRGVCPVCEKVCSPGVGTGRLSDGIFCSLECYQEFRDRYQHLLNAGGMN